MSSTWLGSGRSRIAMQEDGGACCALPRMASVDNHPLLRRRGGRGGWETESLGCGIGEAVRAINIDPTRQNRCGAYVLLCELMAPSSVPDRRCRRWVRRVSLGLMGRRERAHDRRPQLASRAVGEEMMLVPSAEERRNWIASSAKSLPEEVERPMVCCCLLVEEATIEEALLG
ncbi:hypothetical protein BHM03_00048319 [Ensete ventricosum]|nr:hypothetical protein BHM03_00048319 [Ensete ventricosum]